MARSKSKLVPPSTTAITTSNTTSTSIPILPQTPNADDSHPPDPNPPQNEEEEEEEEEENVSPPPLLQLLTSAISLSLRFLSDSDLLLPPAPALTLSSLLRSSALSLISIIPNNNIISSSSSNNNLPPPSPSTLLLLSSSSSSSSTFCWYRRFLSSPLSSSLFPSHFHLSKPSFNLLLSHLSPSLLSLSSSSSPLPPDLKLATALFRLAHAAPFPFLARRFGLPSPSLAARAFYEVIRSLALNLFPLSSSSSSSDHHLPQCHAALLYFRLPVSGVFGSLIAQFLIDSNSRFLDVSVGWHGSMNPPDILPRTKLFTSHSEVLGPGNYFIGHSCCPLLPWLLTPYKNLESGASSKAAVFNSVHARGMEVAKRAVARLKRRWRLLEMEWKEECVEALPYVVVASCLLHNFLIKCGEMEEEEEEEEEGGEREVMGFKEFEGKGDEEGEMVRDVIASHLSQVLLK